jgi:hypothetical protein
VTRPQRRHLYVVGDVRGHQEEAREPQETADRLAEPEELGGSVQASLFDLQPAGDGESPAE